MAANPPVVVVEDDPWTRLIGVVLDPPYGEPGRGDDELLAFDNVILTPHMAGSPRSNGLRDIEELITGLAQALLE